MAYEILLINYSKKGKKKKKNWDRWNYVKEEA
jgi:hypothetical protein